MILHDTHAHLDLLIGRELDIDTRDNSNDELDGTDVEELAGGISLINTYLRYHQWVIQPTVSLGNFKLNRELWRAHPKVKLLLGAHPEIVDAAFEFDSYIMSVEQYIPELLSSGLIGHQVVGIGKCGLDYYYTQNSAILEIQKRLFWYHIDLASQLNLPLAIHTRDAWEDTLEILARQPRIHGRFQIHCFTGNTDHMRRIQDMGGYIAIGGIVTFNSARELQQAVRQAPEDMLLLETDLPFLAPVPHRGATCVPEHIRDIASYIARLRGCDTDYIIALSARNSSRLYGQILDQKQ